MKRSTKLLGVLAVAASIVTSAAVTSAALAEAPAPAPSETQPISGTVTARTYELSLKERDLAYIAGLLQGQPYRDAAPVLNNIQSQIDAAAMAAADAKVKAAADAAKVEAKVEKPEAKK